MKTGNSTAAPISRGKVVQYVGKKGYAAAADRFDLSMGKLHSIITEEAARGTYKKTLVSVILH